MNKSSIATKLIVVVQPGNKNFFNKYLHIIRQYEPMPIVLMGSKNTDCKAELAIFACPAAYNNNNSLKWGRNP